jgi:hypothetical protein
MKSIFLVLIVLLISASLFAQPFNKGDKIGQVGIGFGHAGAYGSMGFPPIFAGFQYGLEDKISVGGLVGFSTSSDDFGYGKWTYTYIFIGARGEYHFLEHSDNIDAYAGITLGYDIVSSSVTWKEEHVGYNWSASGSYALWGFHIGAKYYFNPKIAAFAEVGYGVSYISAGVAFKL